MVSTPRCGRGNPGSNPGYGSIFILIKVGSDETRHLFGTRVGNFNFMGNHLIAFYAFTMALNMSNFVTCLYTYQYRTVCYVALWSESCNIVQKRYEKGKFRVAIF